MAVKPKDWAGLLITTLDPCGFLNDKIPIYDLADPVVRRHYDEAVDIAPARSILRDKTSWREIQEVVTAHVKKHGPGSLIVASGAGVHIYGAIPKLERTAGIRYLSTTPLKLGFVDIMRFYAGPQREAVIDLRAQIYRSIGVVKELGYPDLRRFLADRSKVSEPRNFMIGVEETGFHDIYNRFDYIEKGRLFGVLKNFVVAVRPTSILWLGESSDVAWLEARYPNADKPRFPPGWRRLARKPVLRSTPWHDFIATAMLMGIPVHFGAFGTLTSEEREAIEKIKSAKREAIRLRETADERYAGNRKVLARYDGALRGWCREDVLLEARVASDAPGSDYWRELFDDRCEESSAFPIYYQQASTMLALKLLLMSPAGKRVVDFLNAEEVSIAYADMAGSGLLAKYEEGVLWLDSQVESYDPLEKALLIAYEGFRAKSIEQGLKLSPALESSAEKMQAEVCRELIRAGVPPLARLQIKGRRQAKNGAGPRI